MHRREPLNAETPRSLLAREDITTTRAFYIRSHGAVPGPSGVVSVAGLVDRELQLGVKELQRGDVRTVIATLQCAGNRRAGLLEARGVPGEIPWGRGAVGTAKWTGVSLRDVLELAGVRGDAHHVALVGRDWSREAKPPQLYGGSIPLGKALQRDVILAWAMNDAMLEPHHGAPLRAIVPGYIGARSVKWLDRIEVRRDRWRGFYQEVVYRLVPADGQPGAGVGEELGEYGVNAAILSPGDGDGVAAGPLNVRGYSLVGGERTIRRVDVSADGGRIWRQAEFASDERIGAWRLWNVELDVEPGNAEIVARAWDSASATQPEHASTVWNPKGYANNAWDRITVNVRA